jgi:hypothetical protein
VIQGTIDLAIGAAVEGHNYSIYILNVAILSPAQSVQRPSVHLAPTLTVMVVLIEDLLKEE